MEREVTHPSPWSLTGLYGTRIVMGGVTSRRTMHHQERWLELVSAPTAIAPMPHKAMVTYVTALKDTQAIPITPMAAQVSYLLTEFYIYHFVLKLYYGRHANSQTL